jgi:putative SOS response-associated peptidase YedK
LDGQYLWREHLSLPSKLLVMCVNFTPAKPTSLQRMVGGVAQFDHPAEAFPGYPAPIVVGADGNEIEIRSALFGLIPTWAKDRTFGRRTCNARSETVAEKPSYRGAWRAHRFCLVPMERFYEPCWETGKAVRWSIHHRDAEAFAVAAIWENWTDRVTGEIVTSFSMLTINGDGHEVMGRFHRPGDERRSLVVVDQCDWGRWLRATTAEANAMLLPINPAEFTALPAPVSVQQPDLLTAN